MIRKNDTVMVTTGKDRGKTGKVLSIILKSQRAFVEKLNMVKRHQKPTQNMKQGGIVEKEAPIHLSNLMVYCGKCKKGVRAGVKVAKDGNKTRVCRKCGGPIGS